MNSKTDKRIKRWIDRAVELGADDAKIVATPSVITAPWVRYKCQFGCGGWGRRLTCPPFSPSPEETRKLLDSYKRAVLVHCTRKWQDIKTIVTSLEREMFLEGFYKAFALGSGPCNLCEKCNLKFCSHSDKARPAMEACGIDVFATARGNGMPIEVVKDHSCPTNYYGLVLAD